MIISIIIPVYNEIKTINILLQKVIEYEFLNFEIQKEIIVIDSNSTDGTSEILEKYFKENKIILIKEPAAMGKGHAVRNGLKLVLGDNKIMFPDLSYCTDNGAMISYLGEKKLQLKKYESLSFSSQPNLKLS